MLETVDLDRSLDKKTYKQIFEPLQFRLAALQRRAHELGIPVVVLFEGWEAAGKGTCINRLVKRLDPRGFKVHPVSAPQERELLRPWLWRFAIRLPRRGRWAIFDRSWYGRVLVERVDKLTPRKEWSQAYEEILQFERQMSDDGAVVVKFWLHISKKEQRRRFKRIARDPAEAWKVGKEAEREHRKYKKYKKAVEEMLERTSTAGAPWTVVEATNGRFARVKVLETLVAALQRAVDEYQPPAPGVPEKPRPRRRISRQETALDRVDLSKSLDKAEYSDLLDPLQERLRDLEHRMYLARLPAVVLYEGWDAAGKGGNIKRLVAELDPRGYEVVPIAAPSQSELAHHYLWRFWKEVPKAGHLTIFDRSWYGRVMVERIEGFCNEAAWRRAYQEINEFERMMRNSGTVIVKFWIHISKEEQLRRFKEREASEHKRWKITDEDWRNRKKWPLYHDAVAEMIERTSTTSAPWTIIAGNSKYHARIQALKTVIRAVEAGLKEQKK